MCHLVLASSVFVFTSHGERAKTTVYSTLIEFLKEKQIFVQIEYAFIRILFHSELLPLAPAGCKMAPVDAVRPHIFASDLLNSQIEYSIW